MRVLVRFCAIALLVVLAAPVAANASPILGQAWRVPGGAVSPAAFNPLVLDPVAAFGAPHLTFSYTGFTFDSRGTDNSLGAFLATGGASNLVFGPEAPVNFLTDPPSVPSGQAGAFATYLRFTGSAYMQNGTQYNFVRDDVFRLVVGGSVFSLQASPVAPTPSSAIWTGASGVYDYEMLYGEWNGVPAVLTSDNFQPVPEPASMLLFGSGLAGLAGMVRRRRKR